MSARAVRERGTQETDIARKWWQLPASTLLPLEDGSRCLVLYTGQPGGSAGPDVRDAVLRFLPGLMGTGAVTGEVYASDTQREKATYESICSSLTGQGPCTSSHEEIQLVGDVEFHIHARDWFAHGHHTDPRYNQVILHVVLFLDSPATTRRQDGRAVATCSLLDLPSLPSQAPAWPCQQQPLAANTLTVTLLCAGLQRFQEKSQVLSNALVASKVQHNSTFHAYDICLLPALVEGLGYGRDRAAFRAVGQRLAGLSTHIPEPLGHTSTPAPLDLRRLRILATLNARWRQSGVWHALQQAFSPDQDVKTAIVALRAVFRPLSKARTDILICNVVLPFATAVANLENNSRLAARAQQLYLAYPELVSNRVTRIMSTQLQLRKEPGQACLQQGLHHIYAQTCQAKCCQDCLCGGNRL